MTTSKQFVTINGHRMAYVERGAGVPIVLLHGNPTSSYLWRNIITPLSSRFRCLAPDLIGMGDSDRLSPSGPDRYTFAEHRDFLDGWIDAVVPRGRLLLVVHDWGSALGFDWMRRHPERTLGVAYMEAIVGMRTFADFPEPARALFRALRSPAGEALILEKNLFVGCTQTMLQALDRPLRMAFVLGAILELDGKEAAAALGTLGLGLDEAGSEPACPGVLPHPESAVLAHHRVDRPEAGDHVAPAGRPAGHRDHPQPGGLQGLQRAIGHGSQPAIGGNGLVDVGQHALHGGQDGAGAVFQRLHGGTSNMASGALRV